MKKNFSFFLNQNLKSKGFTLLEVLVSLFIVATLTTLILANFEWGGYGFALDRSLRAISQQIRNIEEMAFSSKEVRGVVPKEGYGIHFDKNFPDKYILFAASSGSQAYQDESQIIEEYFLEKDVSILYLYNTTTLVNSLDIVFLPPDPKVFINNEVRSSQQVFYGEIILSAVNEATGSILINGVGLIEIKK